MTYTIFGLEESPYSVKVRSYFRYKRIPHDWKTRADDPETYSSLARLPLVPLVATPDGEGIQDSTPILERMESDFPEPSIYPEGTTASFVSALLEEFGDEWGNKWMFHYRWRREDDQLSAARRIGNWMNPAQGEEALNATTRQIQARMVDRVWFVGSSDQTANQIEQSFQDTINILETHLADRPYLFGSRPSFADFALWGQIYNANRDPSPAKFVQATPRVLAWTRRMLSPLDEGPFENWDSIEPTLTPLVEQQVGQLFLPWSVANTAAIESNSEEFSVELAGQPWSQKPQKYHARSLAALRQKYSVVANDEQLASYLSSTGCLDHLTS